MPEPTLDWTTAEVKDSTLTVQVDGDLPDGWADTFNTTVKLLGGGSWGEIKLDEQKAEVNDLRPGSEEKLRHFLESVVQQANATHGSDEDEQEEEDDEKDEDDEGGEKESDSDKDMAERFKSFADDEDEDEEADGDGDDDDSDKKKQKDEQSDDSAK